MAYIVNPKPDFFEETGILTDSNAVKFDWQTEPPTEPGGFYWAYRPGCAPIILFVFFDNGNPFCMIVGTPEGNPNFKDLRGLVADVTHWLGPIPAPEVPR